MPWYRRMTWCFYLRNVVRLVLGVGGFQAAVSFLKAWLGARTRPLILTRDHTDVLATALSRMDKSMAWLSQCHGLIISHM